MKKLILVAFSLLLTFSLVFSETPLSYNDLPYPGPLKTFKYQNHKIIYLDAGSGEPLVFIHGLTATLESYRFQIPQFKKTNRIIVMDLPGCGRSDKPNIDYTIDYLTDSVAALLKHLKIKSAVITGHSNGGHVAVNMAVKYPDMVKKLVLLGPGGMIKLTQAQVEAIIPTIDLWLNANISATNNRLKNLVYKWNSHWERAAKIMKRIAMHPDYKLVLRAAKSNIISALYKQTTLPNSFKNIRVPVLIILGKHDTLLPGPAMSLNEFTGYLKTLFRQPKIQLMECGHMLQMEVPHEINKILAKFFL